MNETRHTLIQRLQANYDDKSWTEFDATYRRYIIGFVLKMNFDFHEAEDLTQNILLKLWKSMKDFEYRPGECRFRSWVAIVSRNAVRDYISLKKNRLLDKMDGDKDILETSLPDIEKLAEIEWKDFISQKAWDTIQPKFQDQVIDAFLKPKNLSWI